MKYLIIFYVLCSTLSYSQTAVSFQELGLSFNLPKGWSGQVHENYYLAGHESIPGILILFQNSAKNEAELRQLVFKGVVDDGIQLTVSVNFKLKGSHKIEGFYEGSFDGLEVKCFAIGLINSLGTGLNILIIATHEAFEDIHVTEAKKLASTVNFFEGSDNEAPQEWKNYIVNRQLKYVYTNSDSDYSGGLTGSSDQVIIKLYSDNSFYYYSSFDSSFSSQEGFGYYNSLESNQGRFSIYSIGLDTYLKLAFSDNTIYEYVLTSSNEGYTFLNGDRYSVSNIDKNPY